MRVNEFEKESRNLATYWVGDPEATVQRDLRFEWVLTEVTSTSLQFYLNFTSPLDISSLPGNPDKLILEFMLNETQ